MSIRRRPHCDDPGAAFCSFRPWQALCLRYTPVMATALSYRGADPLPSGPRERGEWAQVPDEPQGEHRLR